MYNAKINHNIANVNFYTGIANVYIANVSHHIAIVIYNIGIASNYRPVYVVTMAMLTFFLDFI